MPITNEMGETTGFEDWIGNTIKHKTPGAVKTKNISEESGAHEVHGERVDYKVENMSWLAVGNKSTSEEEQCSPKFTIAGTYSLKDWESPCKSNSPSPKKSLKKLNFQDGKGQNDAHSKKRSRKKTKGEIEFAPLSALSHLESHLQDVGVHESERPIARKPPITTVKEIVSDTQSSLINSNAKQETILKSQDSKKSWIEIVRRYENRKYIREVNKIKATDPGRPKAMFQARAKDSLDKQHTVRGKKLIQLSANSGTTESGSKGTGKQKIAKKVGKSLSTSAPVVKAITTVNARIKEHFTASSGTPSPLDFQKSSQVTPQVSCIGSIQSSGSRAGGVNVVSNGNVSVGQSVSGATSLGQNNTQNTVVHSQSGTQMVGVPAVSQAVASSTSSQVNFSPLQQSPTGAFVLLNPPSWNSNQFVSNTAVSGQTNIQNSEALPGYSTNNKSHPQQIPSFILLKASTVTQPNVPQRNIDQSLPYNTTPGQSSMQNLTAISQPSAPVHLAVSGLSQTTASLVGVKSSVSSQSCRQQTSPNIVVLTPTGYTPTPAVVPQATISQPATRPFNVRGSFDPGIVTPNVAPTLPVTQVPDNVMTHPVVSQVSASTDRQPGTNQASLPHSQHAMSTHPVTTIATAQSGVNANQSNNIGFGFYRQR